MTARCDFLEHMERPRHSACLAACRAHAIWLAPAACNLPWHPAGRSQEAPEQLPGMLQWSEVLCRPVRAALCTPCSMQFVCTITIQCCAGGHCSGTKGGPGAPCIGWGMHMMRHAHSLYEGKGWVSLVPCPLQWMDGFRTGGGKLMAVVPCSY